MRTGAKVFFIIAALMTVVAVKNIVNGENRPGGLENLIGYGVGSFLLPIGSLIIGLILRDKAKEK